jgi:hypothetical protein
MRFFLRAVFAGILLGAAIFFLPFVFPVFLFLFLIFGFSRIFFGRRRSGGPYGYCGGFRHGGDSFQEIIPIDGRGYHPGENRGGPERQIPIQ